MKNYTIKIILFCLLIVYPHHLLANDSVATEKFAAFREYYLLKKHEKLVKNTINGFEVFIENSSTVPLLNEPYDNGDSYTEYHLDHYFSDIGYLGFNVFEYESLSYEMINVKDGSIIFMSSRPEISSDKKTLIVSDFNEMNGLNLAVYSFSERKIKEEKTFKEQLSLEFDSWIDPQTARMQDPYDKKNYLLYHDLSINDWILIETAEKFPQREEEKDEELEKAYRESAKIYSDKKMALDAVKSYASAIKFIPESFYSDKDIIKAAVAAKQGRYLELASADLKNDKEIVKIAVSKGGESLQFASEKMRDDKDVVKAAIGQNIYAFELASDRLKADRDVLLHVASVCRKSNYPQGYYSPKEQKCGETLNSFPTSLAKDKNFLLKIAQSLSESWYNDNNRFFSIMSPALKDDSEFMMKLIKMARGDDFVNEVLSSLSPRLQQDKNFIKTGVEINPEIYGNLSEKMKMDEEIFLRSSGNISNIPSSISNKLRSDKRFFLEFVKFYPGTKEELNQLLYGVLFFPRSFSTDPETIKLISEKKFR